MSDIFVPGAVPVHGVYRKLKATAGGTIVIPKGAIATRITIRNNTANAVTGGVKVGSTNGGTDVLAAGAVGASAVVSYPALSIAADMAAARTLYFDAVTAFNSANLDIVVETKELI